MVARRLDPSRRPWSDAASLQELAVGADPTLVDDVAGVLTLVRKAKSEAKASMRADVTSTTVIAEGGGPLSVDVVLGEQGLAQ